ncbi:MAG TPA: leucine--tRNA ligase [Candidatus Paceibacterota bacterium]
MNKYDHKKIEKKWQQKWAEAGSFKTADDSTKEKQYILDMFPYPSGAGLHVGHVEGYTATDIYSRYKRAKGYNVLHPMGWDAFGLPAENYAIKTGTPPQRTTDESIANFKKQISHLGLSYDWSREFGTHNPEYYKWTQWLFAKFFEKGLVYKKKALVNWDPVDQTVLANEQVLADGTAERSGAKVEKKELEQWFFKITDYADELVDGLEPLDWPESTKINQRNWIGRSEGLIFTSPVKNTALTIDTFSAHFEAYCADTFVVIAPDHPFLPTLLDGLPDKEKILAQAKNIADKRSLTERGEVQEVEGIFTGRYTVDPVGNGELPIWIASYALAEYGTGIVKCSAHDERDFAFAKKYTIPLKVVLVPEDPAEQVAVKSFERCYADMKNGILLEPPTFAGKKAGDVRSEIIAYVSEREIAKAKTTYRLRDWLISRQRYWGAPIPIVYDPEGKAHAVPEEHLPWLLPTDVEYLPKGTSPLGTSKELFERTEKIFGKGWKPEVDTMDTFACSSWYFLRFADPHNTKEFASKKAMHYWLPVDLYLGGAEHTVLHLLYARFFTKVLRDMGYISFSEPFLKLRHQGIVLAEDSRKMSKRWGNVINPDDMVERFGADSVRLYEMFMGPLEAMKPWNTNNIMGVRRFLEHIWALAQTIKEDGGVESATEALLYQTIEKVTKDIEALKLNTAVSALMIYSNHLRTLKVVPTLAYKPFLQLLAPFAPHIACELAEQLGFTVDTWPVFDPLKAASSMVTIAVQINGKARATIKIPVDMPEQEALQQARSNPAIADWLTKGKEGKAVYVPGRIINFVLNT